MEPLSPTTMEPLSQTAMELLSPDKERGLNVMLANVPKVDAFASNEHLELIAASNMSWRRACVGLGISEVEEEEIANRNSELKSQR